jgi:hypothetical protein
VGTGIFGMSVLGHFLTVYTSFLTAEVYPYDRWCSKTDRCWATGSFFEMVHNTSSSFDPSAAPRTPSDIPLAACNVPYVQRLPISVTLIL